MLAYNVDRKRIDHYKWYHVTMQEMGDCDPAYPALCYLADRFELTEEQRYWLAFLYQATYCVPTVYYIYSEFPDYENVDVRRLQHWWEGNKQRLFFQTDRAKVKNFDKLVSMFESYRDIVGKSQVSKFTGVASGPDELANYDGVYALCRKIYYVGRYSLFLYLESIYRLTGLPIAPSGLELEEAESSRNGLCYALGLDEWVDKKLDKEQFAFLKTNLAMVLKELKKEHPGLGINYWSLETSLCAYKKLYWKTRYLGYYIDRQQEEIKKMEDNVPEGVDWSVLWDFRREFFLHEHLGELHGRAGVRTKLYGLPNGFWGSYNGDYKERLYFRGAKEAYV